MHGTIAQVLVLVCGAAGRASDSPGNCGSEKKRKDTQTGNLPVFVVSVFAPLAVGPALCYSDLAHLLTRCDFVQFLYGV